MIRHRTEVLDVIDFHPSRLRYEWHPAVNSASHNFRQDVHGFALWEASRAHEDEILERLNHAFLVRRIYEVTWSPEKVSSNFNRLYGRNPHAERSRHVNVGAGPFLYVIVEDQSPNYLLFQNVSGLIEVSNKKITQIKPLLREMTKTEFLYNVHSSNSIQEFMRDASLILGSDELDDFLQDIGDVTTTATKYRPWKQDMAGANGYSSINQLFKTIARTQKIALLRSADSAKIPISAKEGDIDILCDNASQLASDLNADRQSYEKQDSHYFVDVAGTRVHFDLREVNDGDLDASWQRKILCSVQDTTVPYPELDLVNQFFYLLYHTIVHKGYIKHDHAVSLINQAQMLGLKSPVSREFVHSQSAFELLSGFLKANNYRVTFPTWPKVAVQRQNIIQLMSEGCLCDQGVQNFLSPNILKKIAKSTNAQEIVQTIRRTLREIPIAGAALAKARNFFRAKRNARYR